MFSLILCQYGKILGFLFDGCRTGFEEELMKEYTPWQLEKCYGGTRPEVRTRIMTFQACLGATWNLYSRCVAGTTPQLVSLQFRAFQR